MKFNGLRVFKVFYFCAATAALQTHGALLNTGYDPSSPYFADFSSADLSVNYTYDGSVGTFTASSTANAYTSSSLSYGTHGAYSATPFDGSYTLSATIQDVSGNWEVTAGSITVNGNLLGGTSGSPLLSANLNTGMGTIGYGAGGTTEFDFLFTTAGGNPSIVADFFGEDTGEGAVIINTGAYDDSFTSLAADFSNTGAGTAQTFVPEPGAYPVAAAIFGLSGFIFAARRSKIQAAARG